MRALTIRNVYDKSYITMAFTGIWEQAMGQPEHNGCWLIYGIDKNGKTTFSLQLANYLTTFDRVLYISAEEGVSKSFRDTCQGIGISSSNRKLQVMEYISIEELDEKLSKRKAPRIVFLDNATTYADELKKGVFQSLLAKHPTKLFVLVAHEERSEPYTSLAKYAKKIAKIIVRVKGLACMVSGRVPGGTIMINEEKATLYWGMDITTTTKN